MSQAFSIIIGLSCIIPAAIGLYFYKKMDTTFHPFVGMAVLTIVVEMINYLALRFPLIGKIQPIAINLYMLVNFSLYLLLLCRGGYIRRKGRVLLLIIAMMVAIFNLLYNKTVLLPLFYLLCFVSSIMLFASIDILSKQIFTMKRKLADSFWFWFSSTAILYNAFNLLIFGIYIFAMFNTPAGKAIGNIQHFGNLACQLLFAFAMTKTIDKSNQIR